MHLVDDPIEIDSCWSILEEVSPIYTGERLYNNYELQILDKIFEHQLYFWIENFNTINRQYSYNNIFRSYEWIEYHAWPLLLTPTSDKNIVVREAKSSEDLGSIPSSIYIQLTRNIDLIRKVELVDLAVHNPSFFYREKTWRGEVVIEYEYPPLERRRETIDRVRLYRDCRYIRERDNPQQPSLPPKSLIKPGSLLDRLIPFSDD